jgi:hypothetical protein
MFIPATVEATLRNAHTRCVLERTSGSESMSRASAFVIPFCTSAPYPPMKSMFASCAALLSVLAISIGASSGHGSIISETGVTDILLLIMGMPYLSSSFPASRQVFFHIQ